MLARLRDEFDASRSKSTHDEVELYDRPSSFHLQINSSSNFQINLRFPSTPHAI
ncbi:MAG: hypothetical protein RL516_1143 [Bacteroidota bacterium]|jgi:hypothetical protein